VIDYYDRGGRPNPHLDPEIRPLELARGEKRALAAFLRSLSGRIREGVE
jgi:cytochrome c peroxidase